jgi:hypothetical protein
MNDHAGWDQNGFCILCLSDDARAECSYKPMQEFINCIRHIEISHGENKLFFDDEENVFEVHHEVYFNPHSNPKSLIDIKKFSTASQAIIYFTNIVKKLNSNES